MKNNSETEDLSFEEIRRQYRAEALKAVKSAEQRARDETAAIFEEQIKYGDSTSILIIA